MTTRQFILDNFAWRVGQYFPQSNIIIGQGNPRAKIVTIQPHRKFPTRDSVTGALKRFNMLDDTYRTTCNIIDNADKEINRYYLKELIEIISPQIVVIFGKEALGLLLQRQIRSFSRYSGKKIKVVDIPTTICFATINPMEYGYTQASASLKTQGKNEWEKLSKIFIHQNKLQEKVDIGF